MSRAWTGSMSTRQEYFWLRPNPRAYAILGMQVPLWFMARRVNGRLTRRHRSSTHAHPWSDNTMLSAICLNTRAPRRSLNLRFVTSIRKLMSICIGRPWWLVWIACLKLAIGLLPANLGPLTDERSISTRQMRQRRLPTSLHGAFRSIRVRHGSKLSTFATKTVKLFARFSMLPTKGLAILATGWG